MDAITGVGTARTVSADATGLPRRGASKNLTRFPGIKPKGRGLRLASGHAAMVEDRTIFPTTVNPVDHPRVKRLLKSGHNSRKIGKSVQKGARRGWPIYTLTLEERATCPARCPVRDACYGNGMPYAQRLAHGAALEAALWLELAALDAAHPDGFLVRLHVLGDFYSLDYVDLWGRALDAFPALAVFGFTAWHYADDAIGRAIWRLGARHRGRFAIRFSGQPGRINASRVVEPGETDPDAVMCPAQTGATTCCATCALCWESDRSIAFVRH